MVDKPTAEELAVKETVVEELRVDHTAPVDAALEDVAPEDASVLVPENPDAMADNSWERILRRAWERFS
jgi:hypothetical protein